MTIFVIYVASKYRSSSSLEKMDASLLYLKSNAAFVFWLKCIYAEENALIVGGATQRMESVEDVNHFQLMLKLALHC